MNVAITKKIKRIAATNRVRKDREEFRAVSNNKENPNKNICVLRVAWALGCGKASRYLHCAEDLVYAVRKMYSVRSRKSAVKGLTIGRARAKCLSLANEVKDCVAFIATVKGHVLLLNRSGETMIDTDPRKRDRRKIVFFYIVYGK
ncbi:hypothetical protein DRJ16_05930 [Candidatus Woesearchaeota archaeon]|nr:MAG: hypothetical protein DRJ16_05930 [Candidatus Woesearchaeota archaeon]